MPGRVEQHHEGEDQQEDQGQNDHVGVECRLVHGCGNAEGSAGQPDGQSLDAVTVFGDPFLGHVNGPADGFALAVLVEEHQIGDTVVGVIELIQGAGNRA